MKCPLCDTTLPDGATECTRCDWLLVEEKPIDVRDRMAAILSIIPGLGQLYKGYIILGGLIFFIVGPLIVVLFGALAPATLGVSLLVPVAFMLGVGVHAFMAPDRRQEAIEAARKYDAASSQGGH